ncbi:hypothetical protein TNCV_1407611 [Trichonephila clavipes]|nr:hypothetical protein TNCV_1407611 [Trichonephila clavipes]
MLRLVFESDPHVCRVAATRTGESGVWGSCCVPFGPCFSANGRQEEPAPCQSVGDCPAVSIRVLWNTKDGFRLVLQLGALGELADHIPNLYYYTPVPPLSGSTNLNFTVMVGICVAKGNKWIPLLEYIPNPLRCFNCQRYGHSKNVCRGQPTCPRCGEVGHDSNDCGKKERCVNCKEARRVVSSRTPVPGKLCKCCKKQPKQTLPKLVLSIFKELGTRTHLHLQRTLHLQRNLSINDFFSSTCKEKNT